MTTDLDSLTDVTKGVVVDGTDYAFRADGTGHLTLAAIEEDAPVVPWDSTVFYPPNVSTLVTTGTQQGTRLWLSVYTGSGNNQNREPGVHLSSWLYWKEITGGGGVSQADFDTEQAVRGSYSGLIQNGAFALGDGTNFTQGNTFSKERAAKLNSGGSLVLTTAAGTSTLERVSVSPSVTYKLSMDWLVDDFLTAPSCLAYFYTQFYDAAGETILHTNGNIRSGTTGAELTADINVGDTSISVVSHDWWLGNQYSSRIKLPYVASGIDYNGTPYSRRFMGTTNSEVVIDWANTTSTSIALTRPVAAGETALSGQTIWQATDGTSYVYVTPTVKAADGQPLLSTDINITAASTVYAAVAGRILNFSWELDGVASNTAPWVAGKMPPGTASVAIGTLPRYGTTVPFKNYVSNFNMNQVG